MAAVSVLIPVYNTEAYLRRCLDSVMGQTLQDLEIICVNDGSTDGSADILREYQRKDPRIRVITKPNGGLPSARNAGLDAAAGEYVGFVDSDDFPEPDMFRRLYEEAKRKNCDVVVCGAIPESESGQEAALESGQEAYGWTKPPEWLTQALSPKRAYYRKWNPKLLLKESGTCPFLWRTLIRRALIERHCLRLDETVLLGEDTAFLCKVYPRAHKVAVLPDRLYHYCWNRTGSLMNNAGYRDREQRAHGHVRLAASAATDWRGSGITAKQIGAAFPEWMLGLIYEDLCTVSLQKRAVLARELEPVFNWYKAGRGGMFLPGSFSGGIWRKRLKALIEVSQTAPEELSVPALSVIIPAGGRKRELRQAVRRLCGQTGNHEKKGLEEIILLDYKTSPGTDVYIEKLLSRNGRIRRYPASDGSLMECIREGMIMAEGDRIRILLPSLCPDCPDGSGSALIRGHLTRDPSVRRFLPERNGRPSGLLREEDPEQLLADVREAFSVRERQEERMLEGLYLWLSGEEMRRYLLAYCLRGQKEGRKTAALLLRIQAVLTEMAERGYKVREDCGSGVRPLLSLIAECLMAMEDNRERGDRKKKGDSVRKRC